MEILMLINYIVSWIFVILYFYQYFYIVIGTIAKPRKFETSVPHRFAILISARNEENVLPHLINSIKAQDYPSELVDIFVVADNCTDATAEVSQKAGAFVYERFDKELVGKGHALTFLFSKIYEKCGTDYYDGFFVFDADNLLEPNYITEMNKTFSNGYKIITSYRNSKNFGDNWISAGYALWFIHEAVHLNNPRMILHTSCAVSGTGFLFDKTIALRNNGWKYYLLTEDIEFSVDSVLHGEKIGYCHTAVFYDEQPTKFSQAWKQRMRWARGYLQIFRYYGSRLIHGIFNKKTFTSCYDMSMTIMPAIILSLLTLICNLGVLLIAAIERSPLLPTLLLSFGQVVFNAYLMLFAVGLIAGIKEYRKINCAWYKRILYFFTFPIYMFTYVPITIAALFKKVQWTPIEHPVAISYDECKAREKN